MARGPQQEEGPCVWPQGLLCGSPVGWGPVQGVPSALPLATSCPQAPRAVAAPQGPWGGIAGRCPPGGLPLPSSSGWQPCRAGGRRPPGSSRQRWSHCSAPADAFGGGPGGSQGPGGLGEACAQTQGPLTASEGPAVGEDCSCPPSPPPVRRRLALPRPPPALALLLCEACVTVLGASSRPDVLGSCARCTPHRVPVGPSVVPSQGFFISVVSACSFRCCREFSFFMEPFPSSL